MKNLLLLSIIIPFYGEKNDLKIIMDNLINSKETINHLEIIIVNNTGTTYPSKYEKYAIVINQKKETTLSLSWEIGWLKSSTEYVYFMDINNRIIISELLLSIKRNYPTDILIFNCTNKENQIKIWKIHNSQSFMHIVQSNYKIWLCIFKRKNIRSEFFLKEKWMGEDVYFLMNVFSNSINFKKVDIYTPIQINNTPKSIINKYWLTYINTLNALIINTKDNSHAQYAMTTKKLFEIIKLIISIKVIPKEKEEIYKELCNEMSKCNIAFWRLKFIYKFYYIFIKWKIHWWLHKFK